MSKWDDYDTNEQVTIEEAIAALALDEKLSDDEKQKYLVDKNTSTAPMFETLRESPSNYVEISKNEMSSLTVNEMLREMTCSLKLLKDQPEYVEISENFPQDDFKIRCTEFKKSIVQDRLAFLNNASKEELKGLKGIGKKRIGYILELRKETPEPFKSIDDLIRELGLSREEINALMAQALGDF